MMRTAGFLAFAVISVAQPPADQPRPQFEAASIRPDTGYGGSTLKSLIAGAFQVQEFQVSGGPAWAGSDRFDIVAKPDYPAVSSDTRRLMMRSLLAERFQLQFHLETKETSLYALTIAKSGSKMKASADQTSPSVDAPAPEGAGPNRGAIRIGVGSLTGNAVPMPLFVRFLSQRLERIVIDQTKLAGRFDFDVKWTPDVGETPLGPNGIPLPATPDNSGASVFTALEEQLGLKLESRKAPVDVYVIDHAEKPSPN